MKKYYYLFALTICLVLLPGSLMATDWSKPDKGYFQFQKDVDNSVSDYSKGMASINFEGMIYNFVNYSGEIIVRKFSNSGSFDIKWSQDQKDGITNLTGLSGEYWQPAPVVFDDQLILFVVEKDNSVSYTAYNSGEDKWSERKTIYSTQGYNTYKVLSKGMAAVVVGEKLCLVTTDAGTSLVINWTEDLETWHDTGLLADSKLKNDDWFQQISAISTSFNKDGERKEKLVFAYINTSYHPVSCEYYFDDSDKPVLLSTKTISSESSYQSVALVEGTVKGDNESTGRCIQAFIKKDSKDNGYIRYRIQRYQLKDNATSWTKQENNLLKQNYGWASKRVNLTVVNFPIPDGLDIRQFMCLVYRSYDDWNSPMNIAWAESDKLVYDPSGQMQQELGGAGNTQYVGYIEGPPPFYVNNENGLDEPYMNNTVYAPVSELEFTTSNSTTTETEVGFDVGGSVKFKYAWFKASLSYSFGKVWGSEYKETVKHSVTVHAEHEANGYYLTFTPVISRARYFQNDTYGNRIDTIYNFSMTEPKFDIEAVELENGLVPGDPATYYNRKDINFAVYNKSMYGSSSNSWVGGVSTSTGIEIESSESETTTHKVKLKLEASIGKMFAIGVDGKFEYSLKTTTSVGNEILCKTALNPAVESTDVTKINYDVFWLKPILDNSSINNWWLHEGAEDQKTWCITYAVTYVKRKDGTSFKSLVPSVSEQALNNEETSIAVFNANETKSGVQLTWETEIDNCTFEIQRSVKNSSSSIEDYKTIGTVNGIGNNTAEYNFTDVSPIVGTINYRIKQIAEDNSYAFSKVIGVEVAGQLPSQFSLSQNYPNPFNPTTKIRYQVAENSQNSAGQSGNTKLVVFDVLGNEVATLVNENKEPGYYEVEWNASQISAGVYFYRLESGSFSAVKKLILLK